MKMVVYLFRIWMTKTVQPLSAARSFVVVKSFSFLHHKPRKLSLRTGNKLLLLDKERWANLQWEIGQSRGAKVIKNTRIQILWKRFSIHHITGPLPMTAGIPSFEDFHDALSAHFSRPNRLYRKPLICVNYFISPSGPLASAPQRGLSARKSIIEGGRALCSHPRFSTSEKFFSTQKKKTEKEGKNGIWN